jgi:predicted nucleic acid-binding protein
MKSTEAFKTAIQNHLDQLAAKDPLFAETLKKENKNIDDCVTYILNEVQKSGVNGFEDSEIYGMAVHYYDEDDIKPGRRTTATVVVNHAVELSEADKEKAKQAAIDKVIEEEKEKMRMKKQPKKQDKPNLEIDLFS